MPQICIKDVFVQARCKTILQVDKLEIEKGQFVGVVGPNGAGKTTLLKLICGLQKSNRGKIEINGDSIIATLGFVRTDLCRLIGYVPQQAEYNTDVPFTVREVVAMGRTATKPLFSRLNRADHEQADYWIEQLGLSGHKYQTFRSLSGGEQQKALIARAMVSNPQILLLDEPTANLDFKWKRQLTDVLELVYNRASITVLMVSHEISSWPTVCKRVLLVSDGQIVADDTPGNISIEAFFEEKQTGVCVNA